MNAFAQFFETKSANGPELAKLYVSGLLTQTQRKNMERIDERIGADANVGEDSYQSLQQFISASPWDECLLYRELSQRANRRIGGAPESMLIIDECAHAKKGDKSVGVARQWNGRMGKQDNCQVGVHSVLNCGAHAAMIGTRLFLPDTWAKDPELCRGAGVPEARIEQGPRTKIELARELIDEAIDNGVQFTCVAFDAFYGRDSGLRHYITERGLVYCADVPANARVFVKAPKMDKRPDKITDHTVSADEMAKRLMADKHQPAKVIELREGENGIVQAEVWTRRVWEWPASTDKPVEVWFIVRRMPDGSLKTSLSNAGAKTSMKRLARWQAGRFYVERCFQDAKSHCGMSQYQARGWRAWHHHMALVAMAVLFTTEERLLNPLELPMLSAADVVELIEWVLVKRPTEDELLAKLRRRHAKRKRNGVNAVARQRTAQKKERGEGAKARAV